MELNIKLIGNIGRLNKREPFILADNEKLVLNFSCATPLTDYYIELKNGDKSWQGGTVPFCGGGWYAGASAGLWCWDGYLAASNSDSGIGGRLCYKPTV